MDRSGKLPDKINNSGRRIQHPELEDEVYKRYEDRQKASKPTRDFDLQRMAIAVAAERGVTGFRASKGWVGDFRQRRGLVLRVTTKIGRKFAQTEDQIQEEFFLHRIFEAVFINNSHPYLIRNMDQTSVRLQNTYKKTLSPKGAKEVRVVQPPGDPEYLTVCLTISANGWKFPASVVFKGNKKTGKLSPRILNKFEIRENNSAFDRFWIKETFDERYDGGTLIRDRAPAHGSFESQLLLENLGIEQMFIPAGLTGTYQPLDVGVNFPFKSYLRKSYHLRRDNCTAVTKSGYLKKPSRQDFMKFVSEAWEKVKVSTVENSFVSARIMPEPLYMLASQEETLDSPDDLERSFECGFSSVEDSFAEE
ncbi:hypothetical protein RvY_06671 [Ramazzottius varieornatus]|uniref:HTH CENPB-type domain-containing protein n=1 Tax=Ramazzottius varieornatus TaxID=947166 RepID=A0A1D1V5L6_RAMVA|nr:hypothetical protein RvY_06671 [Ramazzottius varieornatus]